MNSLPVDIVEPLDIQTSNLDSSLIKQFPKQFTKNDIRTSLQASTADAIFASIFSLSTGGILVSNLLVELDATPVIFGMLSSIPMLVNLVQPVGAYISEQTTSRLKYSLLTFGTSRLLWLILVIGIFANNSSVLNSQQLVVLTLSIVLFSHLLGGLGSASWLSWLAIIVPRRLRGRYFGIRNSACHLTNLICIPLAGLIISHWYGGTIQGYGLVLSLGTICGILSLFCQYFQVDVNPQLQNQYSLNGCESPPEDICQEKLIGLVLLGRTLNSYYFYFISVFGCWLCI